jgi:hypothetical protein
MSAEKLSTKLSELGMDADSFEEKTFIEFKDRPVATPWPLLDDDPEAANMVFEPSVCKPVLKGSSQRPASLSITWAPRTVAWEIERVQNGSNSVPREGGSALGLGWGARKIMLELELNDTEGRVLKRHPCADQQEVLKRKNLKQRQTLLRKHGALEADPDILPPRTQRKASKNSVLGAASAAKAEAMKAAQAGQQTVMQEAISADALLDQLRATRKTHFCNCNHTRDVDEDGKSPRRAVRCSTGGRVSVLCRGRELPRGRQRLL